MIKLPNFLPKVRVREGRHGGRKWLRWLVGGGAWQSGVPWAELPSCHEPCSSPINPSTWAVAQGDVRRCLTARPTRCWRSRQ
eukprot:881433-Prymnesium_polylepis.1